MEYEAAMPVNTAGWGLYSYHNRVTYSGIEQFDMTGTMYMDYLVGGVTMTYYGAMAATTCC